MFSVKFILFGVICAVLAVVLYARAPVLTLIFGLFALVMFGAAALIFVRGRRAAAEGDAPADTPPETLPADTPFSAADVIWRFERAEGDWLDGVRDDTGANWLQLGDGSLTEALEAFAAAKERAEGDYLLLPNRKKLRLRSLTMLRVPAEREAEVLNEDLERIVRLCDENRVRIVVEETGFRFRELTRGFRYGLTMQEYAGSADDAATYGYIKLEQLPGTEPGV